MSSLDLRRPREMSVSRSPWRGSYCAPKWLSRIPIFSLTASKSELFHGEHVPLSSRVGLLSSFYGMSRRRLPEAPHNVLAREHVLRREATRLVLI